MLVIPKPIHQNFLVELELWVCSLVNFIFAHGVILNPNVDLEILAKATGNGYMIESVTVECLVV